jgi:4-hydroxy-4-methyl-2-oxoglutarate aldolase
MNIPLLTSLCPGDIIVAEDDGVVVVPAADIADTLAAAEKRQASEDEKRQKLASVYSEWTFMKCVQRLKRLDYAM